MVERRVSLMGSLQKNIFVWKGGDDRRLKEREEAMLQSAPGARSIGEREASLQDIDTFLKFENKIETLII